jgi:hypothetical protein
MPFRSMAQTRRSIAGCTSASLHIKPCGTTQPRALICPEGFVVYSKIVAHQYREVGFSSAIDRIRGALETRNGLNVSTSRRACRWGWYRSCRDSRRRPLETLAHNLPKTFDLVLKSSILCERTGDANYRATWSFQIVLSSHPCAESFRPLTVIGNICITLLADSGYIKSVMAMVPFCA